MVIEAQDEVAIVTFVVEFAVVDAASAAASLPSVVASDGTFGSWFH